MEHSYKLSAHEEHASRHVSRGMLAQSLMEFVVYFFQPSLFQYAKAPILCENEPFRLDNVDWVLKDAGFDTSEVFRVLSVIDPVLVHEEADHEADVAGVNLEQVEIYVVYFLECWFN